MLHSSQLACSYALPAGRMPERKVNSSWLHSIACRHLCERTSQPLTSNSDTGRSPYLSVCSCTNTERSEAAPEPCEGANHLTPHAI